MLFYPFSSCIYGIVKIMIKGNLNLATKSGQEGFKLSA